MLRVILAAGSALIVYAAALPAAGQSQQSQNPNDNAAVSETGKGSARTPAMPGKTPPATAPSTSMPKSRLPTTALPTGKIVPPTAGATGADAGKGAAGLDTPPPTIPPAPGEPSSTTSKPRGS